MKKLTNKELSAYLPWEVKVSYFDEERELNQVCNIRGWNTDELTISDGEYEYIVEFDDIKIFLLPISYLTKEIQHKGEKFVPEERLFDNIHSDYKKILQKDLSCFRLKWDILPYWLITKLHEWHFDTFGLIDRGLAIDKTTIQLT